MTFLTQTLEELLISERDNIVEHLKGTHKWMLDRFHREDLVDDDSDEDYAEDYAGIDVRLRCIDGGWEILTGDSQNDTNHLGYWGYSSLCYGIDPEDLDATIGVLVDSLISDVLEAEAIAR